MKRLEYNPKFFDLIDLNVLQNNNYNQRILKQNDK